MRSSSVYRTCKYQNKFLTFSLFSEPERTSPTLPPWWRPGGIPTTEPGPSVDGSQTGLARKFRDETQLLPLKWNFFADFHKVSTNGAAFQKIIASVCRSANICYFYIQFRSEIRLGVPKYLSHYEISYLLPFERTAGCCLPPPPPLPSGIGERYSQTISHFFQKALLRRCELPL